MASLSEPDESTDVGSKTGPTLANSSRERDGSVISGMTDNVSMEGSLLPPLNVAATPEEIPKQVILEDESPPAHPFDDYITSPEVQHAIAERSPGGRYVRFMEKLGSGASKDVYRAYDTQEGIEVAWNVVNLSGVPKMERNRIVNEVRLLERLHHQNIISFHGSWVNRERQEVNFVTEILSSGTLKSFINKVQVIRWKIAKRWAVQILKGLDYLHSQDPPVIHRDLKCENIFINGTSGDLRIGDLGLSTVSQNGRVLSVLGTPEFMAPDMYEEKAYDEKVDVYAFGMCLLEIFTKEIPYSECNNPAQIYKKVSAGDPPEVLSRLQSKHAREFVELCLGYKNDEGNFIRPTVAELLQHPFLVKRANDDDEVVVNPPLRERVIVEESVVGTPQTRRKVAVDPGTSDSSAVATPRVNRKKTPQVEEDEVDDQFEEMQESEISMKKVKVLMGRDEELKEDEEKEEAPSVDAKAVDKSRVDESPASSERPLEPGTAVIKEKPSPHYLVAAAVIEHENPNARPYADDILKLVVTLPVDGQTQNVQFDFHLVQDDPVQVAKEMVTELGIPQGAVLEISESVSGLARKARMKQDKHVQQQKQNPHFPPGVPSGQSFHLQHHQGVISGGTNDQPYHQQNSQHPHHMPVQGVLPTGTSQHEFSQFQQQHGLQPSLSQNQQMMHQSGEMQMPPQPPTGHSMAPAPHGAAFVAPVPQQPPAPMQHAVQGGVPQSQLQYHHQQGPQPVHVQRQSPIVNGIPQEQFQHQQQQPPAQQQHAAPATRPLAPGPTQSLPSMSQSGSEQVPMQAPNAGVPTPVMPAQVPPQMPPQARQHSGSTDAPVPTQQVPPHTYSQHPGVDGQLPNGHVSTSLYPPNAVPPQPVAPTTTVPSQSAAPTNTGPPVASTPSGQLETVSSINQQASTSGSTSSQNRLVPPSGSSGAPRPDPRPVQRQVESSRSNVPDDDTVDSDDEEVNEELRKLDEDFHRNLERAKKVFDNRMDSLQRSQVEKEAQHKKTLEKHEKERADFEKRLAQEEEKQNRRIEQLQKDWDKRRETVAAQRKQKNGTHPTTDVGQESSSASGTVSSSTGHLRSTSTASSNLSVSPGVTAHKVPSDGGGGPTEKS